MMPPSARYAAFYAFFAGLLIGDVLRSVDFLDANDTTDLVVKGVLAAAMVAFTFMSMPPKEKK